MHNLSPNTSHTHRLPLEGALFCSFPDYSSFDWLRVPSGPRVVHFWVLTNLTLSYRTQNYSDLILYSCAQNVEESTKRNPSFKIIFKRKNFSDIWYLIKIFSNWNRNPNQRSKELKDLPKTRGYYQRVAPFLGSIWIRFWWRTDRRWRPTGRSPAIRRESCGSFAFCRSVVNKTNKTWD